MIDILFFYLKKYSINYAMSLNLFSCTYMLSSSNCNLFCTFNTIAGLLIISDVGRLEHVIDSIARGAFFVVVNSYLCNITYDYDTDVSTQMRSFGPLQQQ